MSYTKELEEENYILKRDIKNAGMFRIEQLELELASTKKMLDEAMNRIMSLKVNFNMTDARANKLEAMLIEKNKLINEAKEVIGFYNCHVNPATVAAFKFGDDTDSYIGEVPNDDFEILQEGSDSCSLFMGKRARDFLAKHEKKEGV